jgi:hypothetical protein
VFSITKRSLYSAGMRQSVVGGSLTPQSTVGMALGVWKHNRFYRADAAITVEPAATCTPTCTQS